MAVHSKKLVDGVSKILIATITVDEVTKGMSANIIDILVTDEDGNIVTED